MNYLSKALELGESPPNIELTPTIRVVVVGEPSVGKTALTELIANGQPAKASRSTAGCHIHVKLVEESHPDVKVQHKFFVELWDVSGQEKYQQLRSVFYKQINGVILVYDLTNPGTLNKLPRWAAAIAHEGSFVAPFGDDLAARNIGGLPVPVLVVGNKSDRVKHGTADASSLSSMINNACSQVLQSSGCSSWWQRGLGTLRGRRTASEGSMTSELEPHVKGLSTSAVRGKIDSQLLNEFFTALWERRYKPFSGSAGEYVQQQFSGHPALSPGVPGAAAGTPVTLQVTTGEDKRLDDDWV